MKSKKSERSMLNPVSEALSTATLLALMLPLIIFAGCASKRPMLHPLENDFHKVEGGYFMSDFYLCNVFGVDVKDLDCKEVGK